MESSLSLELTRLLKIRASLISECKRANEKADYVEFDNQRRDHATTARLKAQEADCAFNQNERAILTFKARSIQDVITKLQIAGETLIKHLPGAPECDDEMGFRLAIEDLDRLKTRT
jgi:hypothetical protein